MSSITTKTAVPIVEQALELEGIAPTPRKVWAVLTTALAETGYGTGWYSPPHGPEAPGSKNWGAVQAPGAAPFQYLDLAQADRPTKAAPPSSNPSQYFNALDYNPFHVRSDGGKGSWFWGPYKVYPTDVEGARAVVRLLEKKRALDAAEAEGTTEAIARASYGYYTGTTTDKEEQIAVRAKQLWDKAQQIAAKLKVDPVLTLSGSDSGKSQGAIPNPEPVESSDPSLSSALPTLRIGSRGDAVELWQRMLNAASDRTLVLKVDGNFGSLTLRNTRLWQSRRHLLVDGVVGPISWSRMP